MAKIIGNTTATPNPRPDWNQTDETKADYIKNKPNVVTQEVDPTVPAWAKEPTKPTYTAEEVGALPEDTTLAEMPDDVDHRTVSDNEKTTWNEKFDKAGGTITGNVAITGDLTVNGTTFSEDHETIVVEDNMMVLNSNKVDLQTAVSGIAMNKNADSTYGAVYDPVDDTFKFGEGTLNEANEFEFNDGEGLPFAVREDSTQFADGHIVEWSTDGNKLVDSGKTIGDLNYKAGTGLSLSGTTFNLNAASDAMGGVKSGEDAIISDGLIKVPKLNTKSDLGELVADASAAYIKNVPSISASYATISKLGGMTYKEGNILKHVKVTKVESDIDTFAVPEAVQNFDLYGMGIDNTHYNYIDLVSKNAFIKTKKIVFDGTESDWKMEITGSGKNFYYDIAVEGAVPNSTVLCNHFTSTGTVAAIRNNCWVTRKINITADGYDTLEAWKSQLAIWNSEENPLAVVYRLENVEIVDISDFITDDNLIGVEGGGTLTFENEHKYGVPSEITFYLNANDVIGANEFVGDLKGTAIRAICDSTGRDIATIIDSLLTRISDLEAKLTTLDG